MTSWRPRRRGDCADVPRPCPFVGCRYNTFLHVRPDGRIYRSRPELEPHEVDPATSCALDVADRGPQLVEGFRAKERRAEVLEQRRVEAKWPGDRGTSTCSTGGVDVLAVRG
jgi:hypothetical protein